MAAGGRLALVGERKSLVELGVVHGKLLAPRVHGVFIRALADLLGRLTGAVGQKVADALALDDHLDQLLDLGGLSPAELEAPGILFGDDAFLEAFYGKGHRPAGRDRIDAGAVAHLVDLDDGVQVVVEDQRAEGAERLVLGLVPLGPLVFSGLDIEDPAAAQRTGLAVVFLLLVLDKLLVRELIAHRIHRELLIADAVPVLDRAVADFRRIARQAAGAELLHEEPDGGGLGRDRDCRCAR